MSVGFEMPEYQFSEGAGFLPDIVYIVRENGVSVSSNFTVTVIIQATSTAEAGSTYLSVETVHFDDCVYSSKCRGIHLVACLQLKLALSKICRIHAFDAYDVMFSKSFFLIS